MYIWISKKSSWLAALLPAVLAACVATQPVTTRLDVLDALVTVETPVGFCIDRAATQLAKAQAFVLMAECPSVTRNVATQRPAAPALISVAAVAMSPFDAPVTQQIGGLRSYFRSEDGQGALAPDGNPDGVKVISSRIAGDVFYMHVRSTAELAGAGLGTDQWRAIFDVNGQLVTATVYALKKRPITRDAGMDILAQLVDRIKKASETIA